MFAPVFAQVPSTESVVAFVLITLIYVVLVAVVSRFASAEGKLIALGLITAVAATGYAGLVGFGVTVVAPTMMKIGFLLVLGGIAYWLLGRVSAPVVDRHLDKDRADA